MRVLFFTHNLFGTDGVSRYSVDIITALQLKGVECLCIVNQVNTEIPVQQVALLRKPMRYLRFPFLVLLDFWKIKKFAAKNNADVVHFCYEFYALFLPFLGIKAVKSVLTVHGTYAIVPLRWLRTRWLARRYYAQVQTIVAVSQYTANRLLQIAPKVKNKVEVIHNGIQFLPTPVHAQNNSEKKLVICIGEVKERKGILEAVRGFCEYRRQYQVNAEFVIIGLCNDDGYVRKIRSFIAENKLDLSVRLVGLVDASTRNTYLQKADAFIMLSQSIATNDNFEGFGLVYLEANMYGVPTIGSVTGGPAEAIKNGYSGLTVDPENVVAVADALHNVIDNAAIKPENCRAWAKAHDVVGVADKLLALYKK